MKRILIAAVLLVAIAPGCVHVSDADRAFYDQMIAAGERPCTWPAPWVAGFMSILPGGGQFYNAQFYQGQVNFLLWPLSYFWAIPTAISNAGRINIKRSVAYWRARGFGKKE